MHALVLMFAIILYSPSKHHGKIFYKFRSSEINGYSLWHIRYKFGKNWMKGKEMGISYPFTVGRDGLLRPHLRQIDKLFFSKLSTIFQLLIWLMQNQNHLGK